MTQCGITRQPGPAKLVYVRGAVLFYLTLVSYRRPAR